MNIGDFEKELRNIHKDFAIMQKAGNQTAAVLFKGEYQFAIGAGGIYDKPNPNYGIDHPSGSFIRHRTRPEAVAMAKKIIYIMKKADAEYRATMGLGEFSESALRSGSEQVNWGKAKLLG